MPSSYVDEILEHGGIRNGAVREAFRRVRRHEYLTEFFSGPDLSDGSFQSNIVSNPPQIDVLRTIYSDVALVVQVRDGLPTSSASLPSLVAEMLQLLELQSGMNILEIGTGTGYNAALMAEITGDQGLVTSLEFDRALACSAKTSLSAAGYTQVRVLLRDGYYGAPEHAPFDRIIATVGMTDLSDSWLEQLSPTGQMLVPLEHGDCHPVIRLRYVGSTLRGKVVTWTNFMRARGELASARLWEEGRLVGDSLDALELGVGVSSLPLWPGIAAKAAHEHPTQPPYRDFYFFLTIRSSNVCWSPWGIGLAGQEGGFALLSDSEIWTSDDKYWLSELGRLYTEWQDIGCPSVFDYEMEFIKRPAMQRTPRPWAIVRNDYVQQLWT
ncbi:MAG: protein-L-isoaspartate O-methyltransferase family protein [Actinomycetota bacterium]